MKINGADPDYHRRDLWESIEAGVFPEWELGVQVFTEGQANGFSFDVLDPTKIVPEELVPVRVIGRMVLNRNPDKSKALSLFARPGDGRIAGLKVALLLAPGVDGEGAMAVHRAGEEATAALSALGQDDAALLVTEPGALGAAISDFLAALARRRNWERAMDPPPV